MNGSGESQATFLARHGFWLLPALVAAAAYAGTLSAEFVYDDTVQIVGNPFVRELRHLPAAVSQPVWAFHSTTPTQQFRPLQMGLYNLLWNATGGGAPAFHALNVLLHAVVTGALGALAWCLGRDRLVAFGTALLFAVHPLASESVAWIACLPELSYALLSLLALLEHVRSRRAVAVTLFALALLAKETAAALLPLLLVLELVSGPSARAAKRVRGASLALAPYAAVFAGYVALRRVVVGPLLPLERDSLTAVDALLNAPRLVLAYLGKMIWPAELVAQHVLDPVRSAASPGFLLAAAAVAVLGAAVVALARRRRELAVAGGLLLLPLLPVLWLPALGVHAFAERYAYLPLAGFTWLAALAVVHAARRAAGRRHATVAAALLAALALAGATRTIARNRDWHDDGTLAVATLRDEPRAFDMWRLLAIHQRHDGTPGAARETYTRALEQFPGNPLLQAELVGVRLELREISPQAAVRELQDLIDAGATEAHVWVQLGRVHHLAGDPAAAERAYREAIRIEPSSRAAHQGLALAAIAQGRSGKQALDARDGSGFAPAGELDRLTEGALAMREGRLDEAETAFRAALRESPGSPAALLSLALVAAARPDHEAAIDLCRRALEAQPDLVDAYQQLGLSSLALGREREALRAFESAVGLDPHNKDLLNRLGVAYARLGRMDEARDAWTRALEIDPSFEAARHNLERLD